MRNRLLPLLLIVVGGLPTSGQPLFGDVTGRVRSATGPLPGVTVEVSSASHNSTRTVVTGADGGFAVRGLLPGMVTVRFSLHGFHSLEQPVKISAAQAVVVDAVLEPATVAETIHVRAAEESIARGAEAVVTLEQDLLDLLPLDRSLGEAATLSAGVSRTEGGLLTLSGAPTFESSYRIDGVVVEDNLRRQPLDLYVEDALLETTTRTSGISAEFGRFAGGVVSAVTRSGDNRFRGTLRDTLSNDDWAARTPRSPERIDDVDHRWEGTFGGPALRDRLWFFLAGRHRQLDAGERLVGVGTPYSREDLDRHWEGKLTWAPGQSHLLQATLLGEEQELSNLGIALESQALYDQEVSQRLANLHYSGTLGNHFHLEAQWGERSRSVGTGSPFTDRLRGTPVVGPSGAFLNAGPFCGPCPDEERDNATQMVKGSLLLPTHRFGSHDLVFGYERFEDFTNVQSHQTGSDFLIFATDVQIFGSDVYPVILPFSAFLVYQPVLDASRGTELETESLFLHDSWRVGRWTFDLGLRWDRNTGRDGEGNPIADDEGFSPRLAVAVDPTGRGAWNLHGGWGRYVASVAGGVARDTSAAGLPASFAYVYAGIPINAGVPSVGSRDAVGAVFDWFDGVGGLDPGNPFLFFAETPSAVNVDASLTPPHSDETTFGVSRAWRRGGVVLRADWVRREYEDAYVRRIDRGTGQVLDEESGLLVDRVVLENDPGRLERTYDGLHLQGRARLGERVRAGLAWTWSHTRGNFDGESLATGPTASDVLAYPEYKQTRWNSPAGDLATDRRHTLRLWSVVDLWERERQKLALGWVESFVTGRPYGAVGDVDPRPYVANPGYSTPDGSVSYFFTGRDAFRTDDVHSSDLSVSWDRSLTTAGRDVTVFLRTELRNVFDEQAVVGVAARIDTAADRPDLQPFDPFTETPVEGVHWRKRAGFGEPEHEAHYQAPRTFTASVGLRF